ncbi:MAG: EamA family transporter, partial [Streptosporangiaceae bacterium]
MSPLGIGLVLASAVCHATWNLFAKRAEASGAAFVWLMALAGATIYAPAAAYVFLTTPTTGAAILAFAVSAVIHTAYFLTLQRGYAHGDLSVVYPVARGTGPALASIGAVVLLAERPAPVRVAGIVLICGGVLALGLLERRKDASAGMARAALMYGLVIGVFIGIYTVWDGHAVADWNAAPIALMWGNDVGRTVFLAPVMARRRAAVRAAWAAHRWRVIGGGVLSPLSYILVLTALTFSPISGVAPLRECGVLLGVAFGARLLAEADPRRRLAA